MFLSRNPSYSRFCFLVRTHFEPKQSPRCRSALHPPLPPRTFFCSVVGGRQHDVTTITPITNNITTSVSNRQQFRNIPIHPSILSYIQKIGVGIPPRYTRRKRNVKVLLDNRPQQQLTRPNARRRRPLGPNAATTTHRLTNEDRNIISSTSRVPPPPFGAGSHVRVVATCTSSNDFPSPTRAKRRVRTIVPEIAVAGRSNVGKSTLLNALLYGNKHAPGLGKGSHKALVSDTPGETRAITFYEMSSTSNPSRTPTILGTTVKGANEGVASSAVSGSTALRLVDLPGYGFAFVSTEQKEEFQTLLVDYLLHRGRNTLKRILLLLDARHGLKKTDVDFLTLLQDHAGTKKAWLPPIQVVLTKCDLVSQHDLARRVSEVRQDISDCWRREPSQLPILLVSAKTSLQVQQQQSQRRINPSHRSASTPQGGLLELQKELAALVPQHSKDGVASTTGRTATTKATRVQRTK